MKIVALRSLLLLMVAVVVGPFTSGLALSAPQEQIAPARDAQPFRPLHKGAVDLATGMYFRENDDLLVRGSPVLRLRRTYLANFRANREFGIGTTHPGEDYLMGDGERFQWVSLILAKGTRINFRRTSPGTSLLGAVFVHDDTPTAWHRAELRWTLRAWTLQRRDGTVLTFKACGKGSVCSIIQSRTSEGAVINYRRDNLGVLRRIDDGAGRWIALEYSQGRIARAITNAGDEVRYTYDERGRLRRVVAGSGTVSRYGYTDRDELATIEEPAASIENRYADGRCVYQINKYPDRPPYIFELEYRIESGRVLRTEVKTSDGGIRQLTWGDKRYVVIESIGYRGSEPLVFTYDRDTASKITGITLRCPDSGRGTVERFRAVPDGHDERIKAELVQDCLLNAG